MQKLWGHSTMSACLIISLTAPLSGQEKCNSIYEFNLRNVTLALVCIWKEKISFVGKGDPFGNRNCQHCKNVTMLNFNYVILLNIPSGEHAEIKSVIRQKKFHVKHKSLSWNNEKVIYDSLISDTLMKNFSKI